MNGGMGPAPIWKKTTNKQTNETARIESVRSFSRPTNSMTRLNPRIFGIFTLSKWKYKLISSDCRASKIIANETKTESIFWESKREYPLFYLLRGRLAFIFSACIPVLSFIATPTEPVIMQQIIIPANEASRSVFRPTRVSRNVVNNVITMVIIPTMTVPIFGFSILADSNMLVE